MTSRGINLWEARVSKRKLAENSDELPSKKKIEYCDENALLKIHANLSAAVKIADLDAVKAFLKFGHVPDMTNCSGLTAIHHAAFHGYPKVLQTLLKCDDEERRRHLCNLLTWENETPLIRACQNVAIKTDVIDILLAAGALINNSTLTGITALMSACQRRCRLSVVKLLVNSGADVNMFDDIDRFTPIQHAIEAKDQKLVEYLAPLSDLSHCNTGGEDAFLMALLHCPKVAGCIHRHMKHLPDRRHVYEAVTKKKWNLVCAMLRKGIDSSWYLKQPREAGKYLPVHFAVLFPKYFKKVLKATPNKLLRDYKEAGGFSLEVAIASSGGNKRDELLQILLKHRAIPGNEEPPSLPRLAGNMKILFKYFLPSPSQDESCQTLKRLCRPAVRQKFRLQAKSDWEAFCTLRDANLPPSLKTFLFYEVD